MKILKKLVLSFSKISDKDSPDTQRALPLEIHRKLLKISMKMLKRMDIKIDACGSPTIILFHSLKVFLILQCRSQQEDLT